jgi:hypothetical protein
MVMCLTTSRLIRTPTHIGVGARGHIMTVGTLEDRDTAGIGSEADTDTVAGMGGAADMVAAADMGAAADMVSVAGMDAAAEVDTEAAVAGGRFAG